MTDIKLDLSVVLPAYDEAANLLILVPSIKKIVDSLRINYEIIVIGPIVALDHSQSICKDLNVIFLPRVVDNSYGSAVRTGIAASKGNRVIFMDADGSHEPEQIKAFWENRELGNLIIASRYVKGGETENSRILILLSLIVNIIFRLTLNLSCKDVSNSYRLYKGEDLRSLILKCNNFDIVEEILINLNYKYPGYLIIELPATFRARKLGKTKRKLITFAISYIAVIIRLRKLKKTIKQ